MGFMQKQGNFSDFFISSVCSLRSSKTLIRRSPRNIYGQCGMNENRLELCAPLSLTLRAVKFYFENFHHTSMRLHDDGHYPWLLTMLSPLFFLFLKWRWLLLSSGTGRVFSVVAFEVSSRERSRFEIISIALVATRHCGGWISVRTDWLAASCFMDFAEWV